MFSDMLSQLTNLFGQSVDLLSKLMFFLFFKVTLVSSIMNVKVSDT